MSSTSRKKRKAKHLAEARKQVIISKLLGNRSCAGCQYLYLEDIGYSNYTVTDTIINCALDFNPNLKGKKVEVPYDWQHDLANGIKDRWPPTCGSMCGRYTALPEGAKPAHFDVDGNTSSSDVTELFTRDARKAITKHSGR